MFECKNTSCSEMLTEKSHYHIWVNMTTKLNFNTKSFLNLFSVLYSCSKCISISHNFIFSGLVVKKPWTTEEKRSVLNILGRYVSSGTIPGKNVCMDCIKRSQEALSGRTWTAIKFFVKKKSRAEAEKSASDMLTCGFFWLVGFDAW